MSNAFADHLTRTLGVVWEACEMGRGRNPAWAIASVPEELVQEFSTRARHIDAEKDRLITEYVEKHGRRPSSAMIMKLRAQVTPMSFGEGCGVRVDDVLGAALTGMNVALVRSGSGLAGLLIPSTPRCPPGSQAVRFAGRLVVAIEGTQIPIPDIEMNRLVFPQTPWRPERGGRLSDGLARHVDRHGHQDGDRGCVRRRPGRGAHLPRQTRDGVG